LSISAVQHYARSPRAAAKTPAARGRKDASRPSPVAVDVCAGGRNNACCTLDWRRGCAGKGEPADAEAHEQH
jgi:hypothetical protein